MFVFCMYFVSCEAWPVVKIPQLAEEKLRARSYQHNTIWQCRTWSNNNRNSSHCSQEEYLKWTWASAAVWDMVQAHRNKGDHYFCMHTCLQASTFIKTVLNFPPVILKRFSKSVKKSLLFPIIDCQWTDYSPRWPYHDYEWSPKIYHLPSSDISA